MKAIIPVAGVGTKLRPLTYTQPKPLIPVAGKPIITYNIDAMVEAGVVEFIFIIGYLGEKVKSYIELKYPNLKTHFVLQEKRDGLAHAIGLAKHLFTENEEVIVLLGDTIFDVNVSEFTQYKGNCIGIKKVDEPRDFGIAKTDSKNRVIKLEEKPNIPISNLALAGIYKLSNSGVLFNSIDTLIETNKRTYGEFQLTDALQLMIENNEVIQAIEINNFYDCGRKNVLLETNAHLLKRNAAANSEAPLYFNSIIIHPVSIAQGVKIENSIVGPNVTIAENTEIHHTILKNSIIGNNSKLDNCILTRSVIGSDASVKGLVQSLSIGDNTEIDFSK